MARVFKDDFVNFCRKFIDTSKDQRDVMIQTLGLINAGLKSVKR
jgi:hypothetical protein